ncbi:hypothetical protein JXB31_01140, partial [Candidatus Woesearchaeota archaeon]|nr:hypothetical protein [Candidatus Woesearchaeota archaeon]
MRVVHRLQEKEVWRTIPDHTMSTNPGFLLTGKRGGFLYLSAHNNISRYCGSYFPVMDDSGWELFKAIESVHLLGIEAEAVKNNFSNIERLSLNAKERFYMPQNKTILYEVEGHNGYAEIVLDCRKMHDFDDAGRMYSMKNEDGMVVFDYVKYTGEDMKEEQYRIYVAISGFSGYEKSCRWEKRYYPFDKGRGTENYELFVYNALRIRIDEKAKIIMTFSESREEAVALARNAEQNYEHLKRSNDIYKNKILQSSLRHDDSEIEMAFKCAVNSVDSLVMEMGKSKGIYAGLPWFYQFWSRDETIAVKSLILEERFDEAREILLRLTSQIQANGRLSNRYPNSDLGSADSVGWLFLRINDLFAALEKKNQFKDYLSQDDMVRIKERLSYSISLILDEFVEDGLVRNNPLETWVDTGYKDDTRPGFRVEIQALMLSMYRLMRSLCTMTRNSTKQLSYARLEDVTARKVREVFWKSPVLSDGAADKTIRPNIFLVYYIYPWLLSRKEWIECFDHALEKLWLGWGGLSSIDRNSPLFVDSYSGENNRSYHRGDSWFFINNIAAIAMHDLDPKRY